MRIAPFCHLLGHLFVVALLACAGIGWAQTATPPAKPPAVAVAAPPQPASGANQLIERIHVEGGTTQIDELRVGGETRSITVQPRGGLPAYDVQPATGTRAWKVLGF